MEETKDILVPLVEEERDLTPEPVDEYDIVVSTDMDKLIRDVNARIRNGWYCEWWVRVVSWWATTKFYQTMGRWVIKNLDTGESAVLVKEEGSKNEAQNWPKPEMPSENSEVGGLGANAPTLDEWENNE